MASAEARIRVEIVYAAEDRQVVEALELPVGSTLEQALRRSSLPRHFPEVDFAALPVGVFGQRRDAGYVLQPGDRVEFYRPLACDPKLARRRRAGRP